MRHALFFRRCDVIFYIYFSAPSVPYRVFRRRLAADVPLLMDALLSGDSAAWNSFLFNLDAARNITETLSKEVAVEIVKAGAQCSLPLTTTQASRKLHETAGVSLVSAQKQDYVNVWLYALALHWEIELDGVELNPAAAAAAFKLMERLSRKPKGSLALALDMHVRTPFPFTEPSKEAKKSASVERDEVDDVEDGMEEEGEEWYSEEEDVQLDWETQKRDLPRELQHLWQQSSKGISMSVKDCLEEWPAYNGLPQKAPVNNHRKNKHDLEWMRVQQMLLNSQRGFATAYIQVQSGQPEAKTNLEKTFKIVSDCYHRILNHRKEQQIYGSSQHADGEMLFTKSDLQTAQTAQKIRRFRKYVPRGRPKRCRSIITHHQASSPSSQSSNWPYKGSYNSYKGGKGKGKGKGFKGGRKGTTKTGDFSCHNDHTLSQATEATTRDGHGGLARGTTPRRDIRARRPSSIPQIAGKAAMVGATCTPACCAIDRTRCAIRPEIATVSHDENPTRGPKDFGIGIGIHEGVSRGLVLRPL